MTERNPWKTATGRRVFAAAFVIGLLFLSAILMAITVAGYNSSQLAGTGRPWQLFRIYGAGIGAHGIVFEAFGRVVRIELETVPE